MSCSLLNNREDRDLASSNNFTILRLKIPLYVNGVSVNNTIDLSNVNFMINYAKAHKKYKLIKKYFDIANKITSLFNEFPEDKVNLIDYYKKKFTVYSKNKKLENFFLENELARDFINNVSHDINEDYSSEQFGYSSKLTYFSETKQISKLVVYKIFYEAYYDLFNHLIFDFLEEGGEFLDLLKFPVIIGDKAYKARRSISAVPFDTSMGENNSITEVFYSNIEVESLPDDINSTGDIKVLTNEITLYKNLFGEDLDKLVSLIKKPPKIGEKIGCFVGDGYKPEVKGLFSTINTESIAKCDLSSDPVFSNGTYKVEKNGYSYSAFYPEFDKLYSTAKKVIKLAVIMTPSEGFSFSNYVNVKNIFKYKQVRGRGDRSLDLLGSFNLIFEEGEKQGLKKVKDKNVEKQTSIFQAKHLSTNQIFEVKLIFTGNGRYDDVKGEYIGGEESFYATDFPRLSQESDFIIYQGHAGFGSNLKEMFDIELPQKYQSFFILSCSSLDGAINPIYKAKLKSSPNDHKNWDLVASQSSAPLFHSGTTLKNYLSFYYQAWLDFNNKKNMSKYNYQHLIDLLNLSDNEYSGWTATNIIENKFKP